MQKQLLEAITASEKWYFGQATEEEGRDRRLLFFLLLDVKGKRFINQFGQRHVFLQSLDFCLQHDIRIKK
jgi:hypothetical protein